MSCAKKHTIHKQTNKMFHSSSLVSGTQGELGLLLLTLCNTRPGHCVILMDAGVHELEYSSARKKNRA